MPQVWTPDDVRFADLRAAYLESAEQVVADLLAAAGEPESRLQGVSQAEARLRAAQLLIATNHRDRAATIARQVLQDVPGRPEELPAACTLAWAGDQDAVEALAAPVLRALQDRPSEAVIEDLAVIEDAVKLAVSLADYGAFDLAERVVDEAIAAYGRWKAGAGLYVDRDGMLGDWAELGRKVVLATRQDVQDTPSIVGPQTIDLLTRQRADGPHAGEPGMQPSMLSPWPALFGSCLVWWPEAEYQRIVRQVPDLRSVLGATWRDHTAAVEMAMLALPTGPVSRPGDATAYCLAAADFDYFCGYLRMTGADPLQATTMTGFTARLIGLAEHGDRDIRYPIPWPPAERSRCWCGSKARYRRCCGRHG